jgi:hypothetical protein
MKIKIHGLILALVPGIMAGARAGDPIPETAVPKVIFDILSRPRTVQPAQAIACATGGNNPPPFAIQAGY